MKIFHQFQRYRFIQMMLDAIRVEGEHFRILEVGAGSHGNLRDFLPEDQITFSDLSYPAEVLADPAFVEADATDLHFAPGSFDFIIALDVLEHIPVEKRAAFFSSCLKTAGRGMLLTYPHATASGKRDDALLGDMYQYCGSEMPVWIHEHDDCSLPEDETVLALATPNLSGRKVRQLPMGTKTFMTAMLNLEAVCSAHPDYLPMFWQFNDYYDLKLFPHDWGMAASEAVKTNMLILPEKDLRRAEGVLSGLDHDPALIDEAVDRLHSFLRDSASADAASICRSIPSLDAKLRVVEQGSERLQKDMAALPQTLETVTRAELTPLMQGVNGLQKGITALRRDLAALDLDVLHAEKEPPLMRMMDVLLVTYNQEGYIEETLDSILMQETDFDFRIIVADDCSTDRTVELIREKAAENGREVIVLPTDQNVGILRNYRRGFAACTSTYTAVMEGDDLWNDPRRLQKHFDFLQAHRECPMSFNRFMVANFEQGILYAAPAFAPEPPQTFRYIFGNELAEDNYIGNFSTCVYRTQVLHELPEAMYDQKGYDWLVNLTVSRQGPIGYLGEMMNTYRLHEGGTWSGMDRKAQLEELLVCMTAYDEFLEHVYQTGFAAYRVRVERDLEGLRMTSAAPGPSILTRAKAYCPPILVWIMRAIFSPAAMAKLKRLAHRVLHR